MSHIYVQEPTTSGKVVLKTSVGDIELEFWTKECPKATRNFIQHCLNGYYDNTIFHRVVKDFIVVGGDPTGTGNGGESIYPNGPFKDEFHSRLRFNRRGLLATANVGKNQNKSQFFFTLGPAVELQEKHTIFGKVVGDSLYNMLKLGESRVDHDNERPFKPQNLISAEVVENPFPDMISTNSITDSHQQLTDNDQHCKELAISARKRHLPAVNINSKNRKRLNDDDDNIDGAECKKTFNLLSFGDDAEEIDEESEAVAIRERSKPKSSHDLSGDPTLSSRPAVDQRSKKQRKQIDTKFVDESVNNLNALINEDGRCEKNEINIQDQDLYKDDTRILPKGSEKLQRPAAQLLLEETKDLLVKSAKIPSKGSQSREVQTLDLMENFRKKLESARKKFVNSDENDSDAWLAHEFLCEDINSNQTLNDESGNISGINFMSDSVNDDEDKLLNLDNCHQGEEVHIEKNTVINKRKSRHDEDISSDSSYRNDDRVIKSPRLDRKPQTSTSYHSDRYSQSSNHYSHNSGGREKYDRDNHEGKYRKYDVDRQRDHGHDASRRRDRERNVEKTHHRDRKRDLERDHRKDLDHGGENYSNRKKARDFQSDRDPENDRRRDRHDSR